MMEEKGIHNPGNGIGTESYRVCGIWTACDGREGAGVNRTAA